MSGFLTWIALQPLRLLGRVPPRFARALVRPLGPLFALALPSRRRIARRNFELCFPELSPAERRRLLWRHFFFLAEMLADGAIAWCRPGRLDERFGTVEGLEHLEQARETGKGILLLTGHSTSLELGGRLLCERIPTWGVYRPLNNHALESFQNRGRLCYARGMFRRDQLRAMVRHLRAGRVLWYAPDQDFGPERSVFAPFFGLATATATGIPNMARMGDAVVLPMYPFRDTETGRLRVVIGAPFENFPSGDDVYDLTRFNAFLERHIRLDPAQYFWIHRRFKTAPPGEPDRYPGIRRRRSRSKKRYAKNRKVTRILFAPASGPHGSGEYYRCLALARAVARENAAIEIEFLLHRDARVERDERFTYHELPDTPTRAGDAVVRVIEQRRPSLAVFDCTGRVAQFRAAQNLGTRVAWISNRPRKRLKGFRPRQMSWLDLHVVIDSVSSRPSLRLHERALCRLFPEVAVDFVRSIAPAPDDNALEPWLDRLPADGGFAVFVSGGGGYEHGGRPVPELFLEAAQRFQQASGLPAVVVMGPQYRGEVESDSDVTVLPSLPTAALGALLSKVRLAVIGAGNMLSEQALASGVPLVVTAVGGRDQPRRVARLRRVPRVRAARLDPASLSRAAVASVQEGSKALEHDNRPAADQETRQVAARLVILATRGSLIAS